MKKTFCMLSAIVAAACICLTSCNKGQDDSTTPTTKTGTAEYLVAVCDGQSDYIDQSYKITINGKTSNFTVSQMTQVAKDETKYLLVFSTIDVNLFLMTITTSYKLYKYALGSVEVGQKITVERTCTSKNSRPQTQKFDMLNAHGLVVSGEKEINTFSVGALGGLENNDNVLDAFCGTNSGSHDYIY